MRTNSRMFVASLLATATLACAPSPTQPSVAQPDEAAALPAPAVAARPVNDYVLNAEGPGMLRCDDAVIPSCGRGFFASCVQHGVGLGAPGPIARWDSSEWQCFPTAWLVGQW